MPTRCAIYARVSSVAQRDAHTIDSQLRILPEHAKLQGWTVVERYIDDGRSAKAGRLAARDGLARLLEDARAGKFEIVLVVDLDRLTRSEDLAERGAILGALQAARVRVATPGGGELDLSTSHGDLMASLFSFFAAEENRKRRERTIAGKERALALGKKPAGPTPYGYRYDRHAAPDEAWTIDERQAAVVREVYARIGRGEGLQEVGRDLERRGISRPRGGAWTRERLWQLIHKETHTGRFRHSARGRTTEIAIPAIVTEEDRERALDSLARWNRRGHGRTRHVYLLEGLATCARCGARVRIASAGSGATRTSSYCCAHRLDPAYYRAEPCELRRWPTGRIDADLQASILEALQDPAALAEILAARRRRSSQDREAWRADLAAAQRSLARLARAEQAVLALLRRGSVSEVSAAAELATIARERKQHERQEASARRAGTRAGVDLERVDELAAVAGALRDRLAVATPAEWRKTAEVMVDEAILADVGLCARFCLGARQDAAFG